MIQHIGALTISQSPRRDLLAPVCAKFPEYNIIEVGALDDVDCHNLPDGNDATYPLTTTLNNGELVTLDRDFLTPLLQDGLDQLETQGVDFSILLCAGDFPFIKGEMPLFKPTDIAQNILRTIGIRYIAVISPIAIQQDPIHEKWEKAGFHPIVWTMPSDITPIEQAKWINSQLKARAEASCVVLDYVGYPSDSIQTLQRLVHKPIFELGHLALSMISSIL